MDLEEKINKFENKFDKFAFNVTNINKIIAILTAVFIIFCFVFYIKRDNQLNNENAVYDMMLQELQTHQLAVIYSNVTPNDGQIDTTKVPEAPIFTNAKEAVISAFEKFNNYDTYEILGHGSTTAVALGQTVQIGIGYKNYQFSNGTQLDENVRKELYSNYGQTEAVQNLYKDGKRYVRYGTDIRLSGEYWIATFNSGFTFRNSSINYHTSFVINAQTTQFAKSFSFTRDNKGRIAYYKATVILDPKLSTFDYARDIQEEGGTSFPEFSYIEIACIIDRDGHLMSYTSTEKMTLSKHIVFDITTTATTTRTSLIVSHDVDPSIPEPQV